MGIYIDAIPSKPDPDNPIYADENLLIAVGFGVAQVLRGEDVVFDETSSEDYHYLPEFEAMAKKEPAHDWRVLLVAPLREHEYQRQSDGRWLLISTGQGFA